jgi:Flp pilus assembly protein TadG
MFWRKSWCDQWRRFLADERSFHNDERGAVLIYVTLGLTVFLGFSALAIDGSYLYFMSNRAQSAADASALAGVSRLVEGDEVARSEAVAFAEKNLEVAKFGTVLQNADVDVGTWDTATRTFTDGDTPADAVRVLVRMDDTNSNPLQLFFASAIGSSEGGVVASAVATIGGGTGGFGENCLQALSPDAEDAFRVIGTADISGQGCNIQVDSCDENAAFVASGDPTIDLTVQLDDGGTGSGSINVCGGMDIGPNVNLPPDQYVNDDTGVAAGDPFDRSPFNQLPGPDEIDECNETNFSSNVNVTLSPGVYCGGISLSGNREATFLPGTYYIKDGEFKTTGSWALSGENVTFVMTGSASNLDLGGTASMAFSAPTSGDYAGFVFFGDPNNPATDDHRMHGTPLGAFHGIAYFPGAGVELLGTVDGELPGGSDDCSVLIADTLFFNGTVELNLASECSDFQGTPAFDNTGALTFRLVD